VASYEILFDTSDSNNEGAEENDLKLYQCMMKELANKSKKSESYEERIQKFIFNVENFFHHKIHTVKVKFKTKGHSPSTCIFIKNNCRNEIV